MKILQLLADLIINYTINNNVGIRKGSIATLIQEFPDGVENTGLWK